MYIKHLNSTVAFIAHGNLSLWSHCHCFWPEKLVFPLSSCAKLGQHPSLERKNLHTVIAIITNEQIFILVDCDSRWCIEIVSKRFQERPTGVEDFNTVIIGISNVESTLVEYCVTGVVQFPRSLIAKHKEVISFVVENLNAAIYGIGDDNTASSVYRNPVGTPELALFSAMSTKSV